MSSLPVSPEGERLSRNITPRDLVQEIHRVLQAAPGQPRVAPRMSREARTLVCRALGALAQAYQADAADSEAQVDRFHLLVYGGNLEQVRAFMEECGPSLDVNVSGQDGQTAS